MCFVKNNFVESSLDNWRCSASCYLSLDLSHSLVTSFVRHKTVCMLLQPKLHLLLLVVDSCCKTHLYTRVFDGAVSEDFMILACVVLEESHAEYDRHADRRTDASVIAMRQASAWQAYADVL